MQIGLKKPKVEIHAEIAKSNTFGIGDEKVIIELLRTKIYNDPIRVIVQEYICNAYDAHIEAGQESAVHVSLPTKFNESALKVRDYGNGISPERVSDVFTKFGNSTKRLDDEQIGGFGLGAKSAFSYTDAFTVITITSENGVSVKRTYACYIDPSRLGKMDLMNTENTSEPTGTEVIIPVLSKDISTFHDNFFRLFQFFKIKPKIAGSSRLFVEPKFLQKSDTWGIYQQGTVEMNHLGSLLVTLGGIPYKVDSDAMREVLKSKPNLQAILDSNFCIFLKVGEVNIASNREGLYYDDKTKSVLQKHILKIASELQTNMQDMVGKCKTFKEAMIAYGASCQSNSVTEKVCEGNIKFKSIILENIGSVGLSHAHFRAQNYVIMRETLVKNGSAAEKHHITLQRFGTDNYKACILSNKNILIYNDDGSSQINKDKLLTYFKKYGEDANIYVITQRRSSYLDLSTDPGHQAKIESELNAWMSDPINRNLIDESTKDLGTSTKATPAIKLAEIIVCERLYGISRSNRGKTKIDITTANGYYISISSGGYVMSPGLNKGCRLRDNGLYSSLRLLDIDVEGTTNIYFIREEILVRFKNTISPNLKPIDTLIADAIDKKFTPEIEANFSKYLFFRDNTNYVNSDSSGMVGISGKMAIKIAEVHPEFGEVTHIISAHRKDNATFQASREYSMCDTFKNFCAHFNFSNKKVSDAVTKSKLLIDAYEKTCSNNLVSSYPMLSLLCNTSRYSCIDDKRESYIAIIEYITLIKTLANPKK